MGRVHVCVGMLVSELRRACDASPWAGQGGGWAGRRSRVVEAKVAEQFSFQWRGWPRRRRVVGLGRLAKYQASSSSGDDGARPN